MLGISPGRENPAQSHVVQGWQSALHLGKELSEEMEGAEEEEEEFEEADEVSASVGGWCE